MIRSTAGTSSTNIAGWKRCCAVLVMVMAGGSWLASCSSSKPPSTPTVKVPSAAVTRKEVATAYGNFFDLHNPSLSNKLDAIQDGKALQKAVSTAMSSSLAKAAAGAKVSSVTPYTKTQCADSGLAYPCAKAAYTILSPSGQTLTSGAGYAVFTGGKWLVAKSTVCGLLGLFSEYSNSKAPIPGCPS
ncbi:MAG: hypothetical protein M1420_00170 [Actinobacteria bacterium]|nr:hypothetical protein [Actinomycetota bacterium]